MTCRGITKNGLNCRKKLGLLAIDAGYCHLHINQEDRNQEDIQEEYKERNVEKRQCAGITLAGKRCKKKSVDEFCHVHWQEEGKIDNVKIKEKKKKEKKKIEVKTGDEVIIESPLLCAATNCNIIADPTSLHSMFCSGHKERYRFECTEDCPICSEMENEGKSQEPLDCGHWMHRSCILNWKSDQPICPVCRQGYQLTPVEQSQRNRESLTERYFNHPQIINADQPPRPPHTVYGNLYGNLDRLSLLLERLQNVYNVDTTAAHEQIRQALGIRMANY